MKINDRVRIKKTAHVVRYEHMQKIVEPDPDAGHVGTVIGLYDHGETEAPEFAELRFDGADSEGYEIRSGLVPLANLEPCLCFACGSPRLAEMPSAAVEGRVVVYCADCEVVQSDPALEELIIP